MTGRYVGFGACWFAGVEHWARNLSEVDRNICIEITGVKTSDDDLQEKSF
jgi:hypothetical protein